METRAHWAQVALRIVVCGAVLVSTVPAALSAPDAVGGARTGVGLAAVAALCLAVAAGLRPARLGDRGPAVVTAVTALSTCVLCLALPFDTVAWISLVAVATAGLSGLASAPAAGLGAAPVLCIAWTSWRARQELLDVALNVGSALVLFVVCLGWVRHREARELAAAQQRVIEIDRARVQTYERQRQVAAQLHDVLAHTLSGLIVTLQGARLAARTGQERAKVIDRLEVAVELARDGLVEARHAVQTLHTDSHGLGEGDLARWLSQALERLRTGASLEVSVSGDVQALTPRWGDLARSVLMEALTNTVRHAAGAPVRITITGPPHPVLRVLSVGDPDRFSKRHHASGGHGLDGLRERAALLGAALTHGPTDEGFMVRLETAPRQDEP